MKVITVTEAIGIINTVVRGTMAISVDAVTIPSMRKKGNPFYKDGICLLRKYCRMDGLVGFDYENSVNNQANREGKGEREAKARKWGVLTANRLFVTHKDKYYLQMKVQSTSKPVYRLPDGTEVDKAELEQWLQKSSKSSTQADLNKEVVLRDVKMENIAGMRLDKESYSITPDKVEPEKVAVEKKETVEA